MNVQELFGDVPLARFIAEHLHRLPIALPGSAKSVLHLGTWDALAILLAVSKDDTFAVRGGQWYAGPRIESVDQAQSLIAEQYTLFIRHAERHHAGLAELAHAFQKTFNAPVNIHVFATPVGAPGFSWHYDAEDVFIIQTQGEKEYGLRKNTVHPWPLEETLPEDMQYERELMPLMRALLKPGDLLYIPCGYWHKAEARGGGLGTGGSGGGAAVTPLPSPQPQVPSPCETALSLAVGVMSRSAIDVLGFLRPRLVQSLVWRQRLPLDDSTDASRVQLETTYRHLFDQLAADFAKTLADPKLASALLDWLEQER